MSRVSSRSVENVALAIVGLSLLACGDDGREPLPPQGQETEAAGSNSSAGGTAGAAGAAGKPASQPTAGAADGGKGGAGSGAAGSGTAGKPSEQPKPAGSAARAGAGGAEAVPPATSPSALERSSVSADTAPAVPEADYATFISNINKFGLDLGQQYATTNELTTKNVVYSPLSVTYALGMTYVGAKSDTAAEMKKVLGDTFSEGVYHTANNRLARELRSRITSRDSNDGNAHKIELNIADTIFVDRSVTMQKPFLDTLSREYDSGVHRVDFINAFEPARLAVNDWVEEQTKDRIQDLLPMGSVDDSTRLVLVNAIYFYGSWAASFKKEATHDSAFYTLANAGTPLQVPTMQGDFQFAYRDTDLYSVAELPYEGGKLRMTIVLPKASQFEAVRSAVSAKWLSEAVSGLQTTFLRVSLPKFKLTVGSLSLAAGLKALGMPTPFTDKADFSGITDSVPVSLSDVVQKAFIAVDENGTEAAAATAVVVGTTSVQVDQPTPFLVNRPFLFFIRDENGAVLFSGQVVDPTLGE